MSDRWCRVLPHCQPQGLIGRRLNTGVPTTMHAGSPVLPRVSSCRKPSDTTGLDSHPSDNANRACSCQCNGVKVPIEKATLRRDIAESCTTISTQAVFGRFAVNGNDDQSPPADLAR